jgi:hypothetical protein
VEAKNGNASAIAAISKPLGREIYILGTPSPADVCIKKSQGIGTLHIAWLAHLFIMFGSEWTKDVATSTLKTMAAEVSVFVYHG